MESARSTEPHLLHHLRSDASPFGVRRGERGPRWEDEPLHRAAFERDPEIYALAALASGAHDGQRARVLFQLLERSRVGVTPELGGTFERVAAVLVAALPADLVLTVFLALRRARANRRHAARTILRYVFDHPAQDDLIAARRPAVVDALEHALGKAVARACGKYASRTSSPAEEAYLRRHALRFARDPARARAALAVLYAAGPALRPAGSGERYAVAHVPFEIDGRDEAEAERPKTITAWNRGDCSAALVGIYRGGTTPELVRAAGEAADRIAARIPRFDGRVALVLDASHSTRGYGEREHCCIAQSVALRLVLERCCPGLSVIRAGGEGEPPASRGETDLAGALLDALEGDPDVVAIASDGYENVEPGDLEALAAALPAAGVATPVVFCHSKFTSKDALDLRRPARSLPELEFWHEDDFRELVPALFALARGEKGRAFMRAALGGKLARILAEKRPWTHAR